MRAALLFAGLAQVLTGLSSFMSNKKGNTIHYSFFDEYPVRG